MPLSPIPAGFRTVTPYLILKGAAPFLEFLQHAFGAKLNDCSRRGDGTIAHACVAIGDSMIEVSDARPEWSQAPAALHLYVANADDVYAHALKCGATSLYAPATRFYGDREAGVKDAWGNAWFIATHVEDVPPEELEKRAAASMAR